MQKHEFAQITATLDGLLGQLEQAVVTSLDVVVKAAHDRDCDRVCRAAQEAKSLAEFRDQVRPWKREWEKRMSGR